MKKFERARTKEQITSRQEEIITVCDSIYREKGYEAVHFKAVSEMTSVSRPTIYNYYNTKEEIFLDVLKRDFAKWTEELMSHFGKTKKMTKDQFCGFLADSILNHEIYFELLFVFMPSIEKNSSLQKLTAFKQSVWSFRVAFFEGLAKFFPNANDEKKERFYIYFKAVVYGVYPLTHLSANQIKAMKKANAKYKVPDYRKICFSALMLLMADM